MQFYYEFMQEKQKILVVLCKIFLDFKFYLFLLNDTTNINLPEWFFFFFFTSCY